MIGLYGGAFDPPHRGHVALAQRAKEALGLERLLVLVAADPGHKRVVAPAGARLRLARAAFPDDAVELDPHARTVELLRAHPEWGETVFVVGADEFADFGAWVEPEEILRRTRLAVATRPGYPRERLDRVLAALRQPGRVSFFELEPLPVSSSELRRRLAAGELAGDALPPAVSELVAAEGLYRPEARLHSA